MLKQSYFKLLILIAIFSVIFAACGKKTDDITASNNVINISTVAPVPTLTPIPTPTRIPTTTPTPFPTTSQAPTTTTIPTATLTMTIKEVKELINKSNEEYFNDFLDYATETKIGTVDGDDLFSMSGKYEDYDYLTNIYKKFFSEDLIPYMIEHDLGVIDLNGKSAFAYSLGIDHYPITEINNIIISDSTIKATVIFGDECDTFAEDYVLENFNEKWIISSIGGNRKLRKMDIKSLNSDLPQFLTKNQCIEKFMKSEGIKEKYKKVYTSDDKKSYSVYTVDVDSSAISKKDSYFLIHYYEDVFNYPDDSHTATIGWYYISRTTGEIYDELGIDSKYPFIDSIDNTFSN